MDPTAKASAAGFTRPTPRSMASGNALPVRHDTPLGYLQNINHNPLDHGRQLEHADHARIVQRQTGYVQTWWGFPTWRETLSPRGTTRPSRSMSTVSQPNMLNPLADQRSTQRLDNEIRNGADRRERSPAPTHDNRLASLAPALQ